MININGYKADYHSYFFHGIDLSVVRKKANDRVKDGKSTIIHRHGSTEDCTGREHEAYEGTIAVAAS